MSPGRGCVSNICLLICVSLQHIRHDGSHVDKMHKVIHLNGAFWHWKLHWSVQGEIAFQNKMILLLLIGPDGDIMEWQNDYCYCVEIIIWEWLLKFIWKVWNSFQHHNTMGINYYKPRKRPGKKRTVSTVQGHHTGKLTTRIGWDWVWVWSLQILSGEFWVCWLRCSQQSARTYCCFFFFFSILQIVAVAAFSFLCFFPFAFFLLSHLVL